jgi:hypothetical protein
MIDISVEPLKLLKPSSISLTYNVYLYGVKKYILNYKKSTGITEYQTENGIYLIIEIESNRVVGEIPTEDLKVIIDRLEKFSKYYRIRLTLGKKFLKYISNYEEK